MVVNVDNWADGKSISGTRPRRSERREFFRVEDRVFLEFTIVDSGAETDRENADVATDLYDLCSTFTVLSKVLEHDLNKLKTTQEVVANSIHTINRKLDQLVHHLVVRDHVSNGGTSHRVTVSGSGIVFLAGSPLKVGAELKLRLILGSAGSAIRTHGVVRRCRHVPHEFSRKPYKVAVEFTDLKESQRDLIVQHVMKVEADQRRMARWHRR